MSIVVSAKIPKELKEKAARYGIKISQTVREALEQKIKIVEEENINKKINKLRSSIGYIKKDDIVKAVRASRDER